MILSMKFYIKKLTFLCILSLLLIINSITVANEITLWGNYQKAPKIYLNPEKQAHGVLIEIANLIAAKTGDKFNYELAPWARAYYQSKKAKQKNIGIIGIKKNPKRLALFDFSAPIYFDSNYLVVLKERNFKIETIKDLKGLRVSYNRNGYFGPKFEQAKQYFIDAADTNNIVRLKKLLLGRIDAALLGGPGRKGLNMALEQDESLKGTGDKFELLPIEFATPDHIAFSKALDQKDSIDRINLAIKELNEEGAIKQIINKYAR